MNQKSINLLEAVLTTMNTISVVGVVNQDKFVGCYNAVSTVIKQLTEVSEQEE